MDRIRVLIDLCDKIAHPNNSLDFPELRQIFILAEIQHLHTRNKRIRNSTALLYLAFALFVAASLSIGVDLLTAHRIVAVPTILALTGVLRLVMGLHQPVPGSPYRFVHHQSRIRISQSLASGRAKNAEAPSTVYSKDNAPSSERKS